MPRLLPALALLLLAVPAAAAPPSPLESLLASGEALTRAADPACSKPLERALFAAEKDDADYARASGALGLCREVQGKFADAHRLVARALEAAPAETTPAGKTPRWTALRSALRRLDERVARVLVTVEPKAAEVFVDGKSIGTADGKVLAVDPGVHVFEAREGGRTIAAAQVTARAGDLPAVHLKASPPSPVETSPKAAEKKVSPPAPSPGVSPLLPNASARGVAVGVAYGAGAVGAVAGTLAPGACAGPEKPGRCGELQLAFDQRTAARNVALVAGGLAVAAGGTAIVLHVTSPGPVAPASAGLMVSGSW